MMNEAEKRRATNNAIERLQIAGSQIKSVSHKSSTPLITVEFPPEWLITKSKEIRERINGQRIVSCVARLSGCLVRWVPTDNPVPPSLNQHSPEMIGA